MKNSPRKSILAVCCVSLLLAAAAGLAQAPVAEELVGPAGLALQPTVSWDRAFLVVSGPGDFLSKQEFEKGAAIGFSGFDADGNMLPDGNYDYELRLSMRSPALSAEEKAAMGPKGLPVPVRHGGFEIDGGLIQAMTQVESEAGVAELAPATASGPIPDPHVVEEHFGNNDVGTEAEMCIGCSAGFEPEDEGLFIIDGTPGIRFQDAETPTQLWEFEMLANGNFVMEDMGGTDIVVLEAGAPANTLRVDAAGLVGIGTSSPGAELHTFDTFINDFRMENLFGGLHSQWSLSADENRFQIEDEENGTTPIRIEFGAPSTMLDLNDDGNVGINTFNPEAKLHVVGGPGGNVAIVEGGAMAVRRLDGISANIRFEALGQSWLFQNQPNDGTFNIRDQTNSVTPVRVFPNGSGATLVVRNGRIGLGVISPAHPIDTATGARLTAGGVWQNASSRELKKGIESLSGDEAMATLEGLKPVKFAYKAEEDERHVGFIAEEVPDLVASSDRKTLASMDVVAVLTRVVQEQNARLQRQEERIAELSRRIDER